MPAQKYGRIYRDLREKIESGEYPPQSFLPSEKELAQQYSCSRNTVRRALLQLASEACVQSARGRGVVVIYQKQPTGKFSFDRIESMREAAERNHVSCTTRVVQFDRMIVDEYLHQKTGFPVGVPVWFVQRVRCFDGVAEILDNNLLRCDICRGLTPQIAEQSIYQYMEEVLGEKIVTTKRKFTLERVTATDRKYLELSDLNCMAVVTSQTFVQDGRMFEYTSSRHCPEKFEFHTQAQRPPR